MLFITSSLQNHKKKPHKKEKRQVSALPLALVVEKGVKIENKNKPLVN